MSETVRRAHEGVAALRRRYGRCDDLTALDNIEAALPRRFPVVTLCGSTRFKEQFESEMRRLTLAGCIVISVGLFGHTEGLDFGTDDNPSDTKVMLDAMHRSKIDLADSIHVIDVDGYIGGSTRREIEYAYANGKHVTYMSEATPND